MKLTLIKKDNQLIPYYNSDIEECNKLKNNVVYMAEIRKPRNPEHHKKLFALAKCTLNNMPEGSPWNGKEPIQLIKATEIQLGYVEQRIMLNGEVYFEPQHINFESMDQLSFQEFYNKAVPLWASMINISVEELENNSIEFM